MYDKPLPVVDPESAPYWAALKERHLIVKRCRDCGRHHFYPRALCPHCHSDALEWSDSRGTGSIYSYTVARARPGRRSRPTHRTWSRWSSWTRARG